MRIIDLFCGGGGTTTGIVNVEGCHVVAAVNHDAKAIETHAANHPETVHLTEDLTKVYVVGKKLKKICPDPDILWGSVECTNFSNAKGGAPRDQDSRTLPEVMIHYTKVLRPRYVIIENVREFLSWGPLRQKVDKHGNPVWRTRNGKKEPALEPESKLNGRDYLRWVYRIQDLGYDYDYRMLDSADYGAHTTRTRYFGVFWLKGEPMAWPEPTHAEFPEKVGGLFGSKLKKWRASAEKLNLEDYGESIFTRKARGKKPLVENTLRRIAYGIEKYCGKPYMMQYYGSNQAQGLDQPCVTITTGDRHQIVQFLSRIMWGMEHQVKGIDKPYRAILTGGDDQKISIDNKVFLIQGYTRDNASSDPNKPLPVIVTDNKHRLVQVEMTPASREDVVQFLSKQWSGDGNVGSVEDPFHTVATADGSSQVTVQFLVKQRGTGRTKDIETPAPASTTSGQHLGLCTISADGTINVITDIFLRFLTVQELKELQGFPKDYKLVGTQRDQKKFIGNSVVPHVAQAIVSAIKDCQGTKERRATA